MSYNIQIKDKRIIVIKFTGESDLQENERARQDVVKVNRETRIFQVIADWSTAKIPLNVLPHELKAFGNTWPKTVDSNSFVVAVILSKDNRDVHFGIDFSNKVAKNDGLISKMFWEFNEALEWLGLLNYT